MKHFVMYFGIAAALVASCTIQEENFETPQRDEVVFYASFEQPIEETRVYANEDLLLRWTVNDRVSIFNQNTYNQQYKFLGETGDVEGGFTKVDGAEFVTGNSIAHVVSVYPFREETKISENEILTLTLPAEQAYAENTFGLGANTMVSVTADNNLKFKNIGGFLRLKLYGDGVSVSAITLKGNNGEKLAGKASVSMPMSGVPSVEMASDATTEITLVCDTPVELGATAAESKVFWLVVPPVTFSQGFTISVTESNGGVFEKATSKSVTITRSNVSTMVPIEVPPVYRHNVIYYTTTDGNIVTPYSTNFNARIVSNEYVDGQGVMTFDRDLSAMAQKGFYECTTLTSITIPETVTDFGHTTFYGCTNLASVNIPEGVTAIGSWTFGYCESLTEVILPEGLSSIDHAAFSHCTSLASVNIPEGVTAIENWTFGYCENLTEVILPEGLSSIDYDAFFSCVNLKRIILPKTIFFIGRYAFSDCISLTDVILPEQLTTLDFGAFYNCSSLSQITIPEGVTSIGESAFRDCSGLNSITVLPVIPPAGGEKMFLATNDCPIYVPAESVDAYLSAEYWRDYASRIRPIPLVPVPEAVDLGLPSGLKWASFNLGASKPEEYGDYYAWGETQPKEIYEWSTYQWCMETYTAMTKYCPDASYGYNGFTDTKTVLDLDDDAAHVNLGGSWRMPTDAEITELRENCSWKWAALNGINGRTVTGPNGNTIFLPAAGFRGGTKLSEAGQYAYYWSTLLRPKDSPSVAWMLTFYSGNVTRFYINRSSGLTIRPVCD